MVSSSYPLTHVSSSSSHPIRLPNGSIVDESMCGHLSLSPTISLTNVLYVPSFHLNLLSVSKLTHSLNCSVTFYPHSCVFQDLSTKKTIGCGKERDGLYYLDLPSTTAASAISSALWHRRLGHPSLGLHQLLSSLRKDIVYSSPSVCDVCSMSKQTRLPFSSSLRTTSMPFELIHCDVWGSFSKSDLFGAHYFLTIMDDLT